MTNFTDNQLQAADPQDKLLTSASHALPANPEELTAPKVPEIESPSKDLGGDGDENVSVRIIDDQTNKDDGPQFQHFRGILAMLMATAIQSLAPQILFYIHQVHDTDCKYSNSAFLMWVYMVYTAQNTVPLTFVMYRESEAVARPFEKNRKLWIILVLRGLCGGLMLFVTWHSQDFFKETAPTAVIIAMAPIVVYINAYFALGEKLGIVPIVNAFIAILGVAVMNKEGLANLKNTESRSPLIGTCLGLLSMYILSWAIVFIRMLRDVHPIVINLSFGVFGMIVHTIIAFVTGRFRTLDDPVMLGLCCCTATISTCANFLFNLALKYEQAGVVSLIRTSEVVFSFLYQFLFFGKEPRLLTAVGAVLVLFGVFCVTLRKIVQESPESSKLRKYLFFLLY